MSFILDPDATLDFKRDWTVWLAAVEDTIETSTWIVPEGLTGTDESHDDTTATIWLSAGELGRHEVTNRITTAGGRTDDRTFVVTVRER